MSPVGTSRSPKRKRITPTLISPVTTSSPVPKKQFKVTAAGQAFSVVQTKPKPTDWKKLGRRSIAPKVPSSLTKVLNTPKPASNKITSNPNSCMKDTPKSQKQVKPVSLNKRKAKLATPSKLAPEKARSSDINFVHVYHEKSRPDSLDTSRCQQVESPKKLIEADVITMPEKKVEQIPQTTSITNCNTESKLNTVRVSTPIPPALLTGKTPKTCSPIPVNSSTSKSVTATCTPVTPACIPGTSKLTCSSSKVVEPKEKAKVLSNCAKFVEQSPCMRRQTFQAAVTSSVSPILKRLVASAQKLRTVHQSNIVNKKSYSTPRKKQHVRTLFFSTPPSLKKLGSQEKKSPTSHKITNSNGVTLKIPMKRKADTDMKSKSKKRLEWIEEEKDVMVTPPNVRLLSQIKQMGNGKSEDDKINGTLEASSIADMSNDHIASPDESMSNSIASLSGNEEDNEDDASCSSATLSSVDTNLNNSSNSESSSTSSSDTSSSSVSSNASSIVEESPKVKSKVRPPIASTVPVVETAPPVAKKPFTSQISWSCPISLKLDPKPKLNRMRRENRTPESKASGSPKSVSATKITKANAQTPTRRSERQRIKAAKVRESTESTPEKLTVKNVKTKLQPAKTPEKNVTPPIPKVSLGLKKIIELAALKKMEISKASGEIQNSSAIGKRVKNGESEESQASDLIFPINRGDSSEINGTLTLHAASPAPPTPHETPVKNPDNCNISAPRIVVTPPISKQVDESINYSKKTDVAYFAEVRSANSTIGNDSVKSLGCSSATKCVSSDISSACKYDVPVNSNSASNFSLYSPYKVQSPVPPSTPRALTNLGTRESIDMDSSSSNLTLDGFYPRHVLLTPMKFNCPSTPGRGPFGSVSRANDDLNSVLNTPDVSYAKMMGGASNSLFDDLSFLIPGAKDSNSASSFAMPNAKSTKEKAKEKVAEQLVKSTEKVKEKVSTEKLVKSAEKAKEKPVKSAEKAKEKPVKSVEKAKEKPIKSPDTVLTKVPKSKNIEKSNKAAKNKEKVIIEKEKAAIETASSKPAPKKQAKVKLPKKLTTTALKEIKEPE